MLLSSTSVLLNSLVGTNRADVCVNRISPYCHLYPCFICAFEFYFFFVPFTSMDTELP